MSSSMYLLPAIIIFLVAAASSRAKEGIKTVIHSAIKANNYGEIILDGDYIKIAPPYADGLKFCDYFEILLNNPYLIDSSESPKFSGEIDSPAMEVAINDAWQILHNSLRYVLGLRQLTDDIVSLKYPSHIILYPAILSDEQAKRRDEIKMLHRHKVLDTRNLDPEKLQLLLTSLRPLGFNPQSPCSDQEVMEWVYINIEQMLDSGALTTDQKAHVIRMLLDLLPHAQSRESG